MTAREQYESTGGRDALLQALGRVLDDLRRFPYFGFVPEENRSDAIRRLEKALHFLEVHPTACTLSTRTLFPEMKSDKMKLLAQFLVQEKFHFVHDILFADYHKTREKLEKATAIRYPEVLMDLRAAYNVRFHRLYDIDIML